MMKSPMTEVEGPRGKRQHFSRDFVPGTQEGLFLCSCSQGRGALQGSAQSGQRGQLKKKAFFLLAFFNLLSFAIRVRSLPVSSVCFPGEEPWVAVTAKA